MAPVRATQSGHGRHADGEEVVERMLASPPPRPSVQGLAKHSLWLRRPPTRRTAGSSRPRTPGTGPGRPPRRSTHRRCYYARPPRPAARRKRQYTRAVTDSTRRQNAGRKDRKSDGNPVQSQSFPGINCPRPVLASGQYRSVIAHHSVNANQSPPVFPPLPLSRPLGLPSSGTSALLEVSNNYS